MRVIDFSLPVNQYTIEALLQELRKAEAARMVFVNSGGGTFHFFSTLGPALRNQHITTVAGHVASAAIILYLLGQRRLAFPSSTFSFHEVRALVQNDQTISLSEMQDIEAFQEMMSRKGREHYELWLHNMSAAQSWLVQFMSQTTGVPMGTILNLMRNEVTLTAQEALSYGIVHEIQQEIG